MLKIIDAKDILKDGFDKYRPRSNEKFSEIKESIQMMVDDVKNNGNKALIEFTKKFDKINLEEIGIKVTDEEIKRAYELTDKKLIEVMKGAIKNIEKFHKAQIRESWTIETQSGVKTGQIVRAIESVGAYIPAGKAPYPSTVLMTAIPAKAAGVKRIIICSPPGYYEYKNQKYKGIYAPILVAANECGVDEIYKIGSAWAISAMAYGTETISPVLKIIGPGSAPVNIAKQLVKDIVSIDTPAGPSDVAIITDEKSDIDYLAYDLLSQVEHGPDNMCVLISFSQEQIDNTIKKINELIKKSERKDIITENLKKYGFIIKTSDLEESILISNEIAPEHLEIQTENYSEILPKIINAGAIFLGKYSPVPLGDYCAGTNHVLPTGGLAKRYSGLNTLEFMKIIDTLECDENGIAELEKLLTPLAESEGLYGHRDAIRIRLEKLKQIQK
ncbi:MAG: histidinol dehydrogenase [archaeon]|nr:histidinol dehydrogenase [archaeon]